MSNEIEVVDGNGISNQAAMHSVLVMEQWGNGETYNEDVWVERAKIATRKTMEGMFELGQALIVLKERASDYQHLCLPRNTGPQSLERSLPPAAPAFCNGVDVGFVRRRCEHAAP